MKDTYSIYQLESVTACPDPGTASNAFVGKGCCTVFQLALKSLEITAIVLSLRILKTARKNSKGLISYVELKF